VRVHAFGGPEVLKVENIPIPKVQENQVLVKVLATGINPVDTYIRAGAHLVRPELPYIPGGDSAGIVEAIGNGVKNFKVGQRVYTIGALGTYAEYTIASQFNVHPLSEKLSFEQGAAVGVPYYTAYRSLFLKAHSKAGESVLIHGASGGVGTAAVQLAKAHGLRVFATAGTKEGLDLVKSCGADEVFNHREKDYVDKLLKATENRGFNVILEMLANVNLNTDLSQLSALNARVIVIGSRGPIPEFVPRLVMGKELSIIGCALFTTTAAEWVEMSKAIGDGIEKGHLKPIIDKEYSIDEVAKVHQDIINSSGAKGKLILKAK